MTSIENLSAAIDNSTTTNALLVVAVNSLIAHGTTNNDAALDALADKVSASNDTNKTLLEAVNAALTPPTP